MTTQYTLNKGLLVNCPEKGYIELTDEENTVMSYSFSKESDHIRINLNMLGYMTISPGDKLHVEAAILGIFEQWSKCVKTYPKWRVDDYLSIHDCSQRVQVRDDYRVWFEADVVLTNGTQKTTRHLVIKSELAI